MRKLLPACLLGFALIFGPARASSSFLLPPSAFAQSSGPAYVIQPGDTLFAIAQRFGTTVDELEAANPGVNPNALIVGGRLIIPGFPNVSGTLQFHVVELGETLDSIARRFSIARDDLVRLNRIVNPKAIYLGQSLVYAQGSTPPKTQGERLRLLPEGGTLAAFAAAANMNPWALATLNSLASPALTLDGHPILIPDPAVSNGLPWPLTSFSVNPPAGTQGRTLEIKIEASQPITLTGTFAQFGAATPSADVSPRACLYPFHTLHFATEADAAVALQGVCALAEPGTYEISLTATDQAGSGVDFSQLILVTAGSYAKEELRVAPETLDPAIVQPEVEAVRAVATGFTPTRTWDGVFKAPSQGDFRSYFGTRRSYNGGPFDSFHGGLDYSGPIGTPITAPAPGVVVLVEPNFKVYGGVTFIDHGWGVYTGYLHQSKIEVAVGDRVSTGQEIGQVGNTGRVTGPHLHWEVWVGGIQVDPLEWLERSFP
ncbi:MAG: peptidoglycan DD-metalloendopeptidase family protein [Chloroflexi bacterium]|nr:peptidoglycan DD-metalloendopeptidase family protein [Chloroflexota bacterium]